jgi:hypothetical protein
MAVFFLSQVKIKPDDARPYALSYIVVQHVHTFVLYSEANIEGGM